jgi:class 3 adenylate cyclase/pimeloyl-ACP methyl ester carboxylesterase
MARPETRYLVTTDGAEIAYQRFGDGPADIVWLPHLLFDLDLWWDFPPIVRWLEGLAAIGPLLIRDPRGTGMSDRAHPPADLTTDIADLISLLDAERIERIAVIGNIRGAAMGALMAAIHPDRVSGLVLWNPVASVRWHPDYPWGWSGPDLVEELDRIQAIWGKEATGESFAGDEGPAGRVDVTFQEWMARMLRAAVTPGRARALFERMHETDVRAILPTIAVPTLVLAREGGEPDEARWIASQIPHAEVRVLPGHDLMPWFGDLGAVLDEIGRFLRVDGHVTAPLRFLSTVLFTDIVDSTAQAAALGDRRWMQMLDDHHRLVRGLLVRHRGREMDTAGDGFFAAFDSPADAARCGLAIVAATRSVGVDVRAGLHTGECNVANGKVAGLAVAIGARVGALAEPGEVLASNTVKDLTAGSGLAFQDAGEHELKGVPDRWRLFRVVGG